MVTETKSTAVWKWSVLLMGVLNIALMATIWLRPAAEHRHGPPQEGGPGNFIIEQLHFSTEQIAAFNKLRHAHRDSVEAIREENRELRNSYFKNLENPGTDSQLIDSLATQIAANQKKIELVTFYHFKDVRALCDKKQQPIFDSIISEVLRIMSPGPQKGQGMPPR